MFAIGTWALCGFFDGGIDEKEAVATILEALERGVKIVDTAPIYGFGRAEEIVGRALKGRSVYLATKFGLSWEGRALYRDARKETVLREIEGSLRRLQKDHVDLYQLHWPDPLTPVEETAGALKQLLKEGKIKAVGLSNCTLKELKEFQKHVPVTAIQPPYNLFERPDDLLFYCKEKGIEVLGYSTLCRGILGGQTKKDAVYRADDLRNFDPKYKEPYLSQYLKCTERLMHWARRAGRTLPELAVRWVQTQGAIPIWGPKNRSHLFDIPSLQEWRLTAQDKREIDRLVESTILNPVGLEFLTPPLRASV